MDQKKIGAFLKELRKEKELTQEQLAEQMCVSGRTVSRWETGSNMRQRFAAIKNAFWKRKSDRVACRIIPPV